MTNDDTEVVDLQDEYDILGELGRGGSAIVYHARDRALGREVAIKVVRPRFAGPDDDSIARLAREARTVAQLQHPNIVTVHAVKRLRDEGLALVMQYVPGRTLKQAIVEGGPFPVARAERVIRDVAQALAYANARGVVHRDVKPENIFLESGTDRALLSDFGIAHSAEFDSRLTMTGTAIGTPAYMAPEQIDGATASPRSDVYSLGLVAWEMLTGHRPWEGETLYNVIYKQKHESLPPIDEYNAAVPPRLQYIVERMLQKKPAARWAGADGLLAHLDASVLPADWTQWQDAHKRRKQKREVPKSKAAELVGAALATIRFQRPPKGVAEGRALDEVSGGVATHATASAAADNADDDRPTWMQEPASARTRSRLPLAAAAMLVIASGAAVAMYAARSADDVVAEAPVPTLTDVATIEVPAGIRADSAQLTAPDSLSGVLGADSMNNRIVALPTLDSTFAADSIARSTAQRPARRSPPVVYSRQLPDPQPFPVRDVPVRPRAASTDSAATSRMMDNATAAASTTSGATIRVTDDRGIIAAGGRHSCALSGSRLSCWGANDNGQLGDGNIESRAVAGSIVGDIDVVHISAGISHSCAVTRANEAYCWGADESGQLGDATTTSRSAPVRVAGTHAFRVVKTGRAHSCGLTTTGDVACWGHNANAQIGDGTMVNRSTPTRVAASTRFVAVTTGWNHSCALDVQGAAWCWGDNSAGQLGDGSRETRRTPQVVSIDLRFTSIAAGSAHTCAVSTSGEIWCWGRNNFGQLGSGNTSDRTTPSRVDTPLRFASVSTGSVHSCARTQGGQAYCWGRNSYGQLGDGTTTDRSRPVRVAGGTDFVAMNATGAHTCGASADGEVWCWGYNVDGQLGDGTRNHRSRPARISAPAP